MQLSLLNPAYEVPPIPHLPVDYYGARFHSNESATAPPDQIDGILK